jgi:hypothetical protein
MRCESDKDTLLAIADDQYVNNSDGIKAIYTIDHGIEYRVTFNLVKLWYDVHVVPGEGASYERNVPPLAIVAHTPYW